MKDHHLFGQGGEELTGRVPVRVFVLGDDPTGRGFGEAQQHLNQFLTNLRAGLLQQAWFRTRLAVGGEVRISHMFGETRVVVDMDPLKEEDGVFYGGILLQPTYITDETTFFGTYVTPTEPTTVLVDEVRSAGTENGEGGRPAVPGTLSSDETDWLIVQIAKDKPLGDSPITTGAVKIFRIKNPQFGQYVETNDTANTYLLSASIFPSPYLSGFGLEKFFLCGQRVTAIPPLIIGTPPLGPAIFDIAAEANPQLIRIRTFGMQFDSFETAADAHGIVIVALKLQLYVLDTANPTWQLLDSIPAFDFMNDYGAEFDEAVAGSVTTITCSGSNGAGVCSGFEVVITEHDNSNATFSGRIFPMADGSTAAEAPAIFLQKEISSDTVINSTPALIEVSKRLLPPDFEEVETIAWGGSYSTKVGTTGVHTQGSYTEGAPAQSPDKFLGGFLPTYPQISYSFTHDWSVSFSLFAGGSSFDVTGSAGPLYLTKLWAIVKTLMTESGTMDYSGSYLGDMSRFTTTTRTSFGYGLAGDGNGSTPPLPAATSVSSGSSYTFAAQPTVLDPLVRFKYIGADLHTDKLRMRREEVRNGMVRAFPFEDTLRTSGAFVQSFEHPEGSWNPFRINVVGSVLVTASPPEMPVQLLRRGGETARSWTNILAESSASSWQTNPDTTINGIFAFTQRGNNTNLGTDFYNSQTGFPIGKESLIGVDLGTISDLDHFGGPGSSPLSMGFLDYAAWQYSGGSISLVIFDPDTGDAYTQYLSAVAPPSPDPSFAIASTPWSVSLTYPGNYPTVPLEYTDFALLFPMSKYAVTPFDHTVSGAYVCPAKFELPDPPFTPIIERGYLAGLLNTYTAPKAVILRDLRCGGYIAQLRVGKYNANPSAFGVKLWHTHEVYIGNDYDSLPLATVLDEWKALGENSGLSDGKHIFTQVSVAPALI